MAYWKSLAICLRVLDYSETSQIATFFTRERGKIAAIAKGAKRRGSQLLGLLEPVTQVEVVCVKRRDGPGLHTLTELDVRDTYRAARQDLARLHAATYVVELLREATREDDPQPDLYDLAAATLAQISSRERFDALTVIGFEARALEQLGLFPELDACVECGAPAAEPRRVSAARGGALCPACAPRDRTARELSPGAFHALKLVAREPEKAARLRLAPAQHQELRGLLNATLSAALDKTLRLAKYL